MENFNLSFPIDMIKKEQRIVSGIATADNIDKAGDIVDFNASKDAFASWGGNIREMHAPIAVGKAINYEPVEIEDRDGRKYNAIRVDAYISKGAESTWQKVLDGTLKAFSIGGKIIEKSDEVGKMYNGRQVRRIKKYVLGELSLVDNPANAIAVVDIIKRNNEGDLDYVLDSDVEKARKEPLKDPKGGLTAAGRRHFKQTEGANLKPGVRGPADTPEKMRRKGSFLTRFFTNPSGPMKDDKGRPTRLALSAAAWGEPVPQNMQDAAKLAAKGRRLLERYAKLKNKSADEILEEDEEILLKEMEFFMKQGEVTTSGMGSGIKNPTQGYFTTPTMPSKKRRKKKGEDYMKSDDLWFEVVKRIVNEESNLEKAATKRENGEDFPSSAFAYVPDANKPSTWKLRLWETLDSRETPAQVGRAVAALGEGFRGNRVSIPEADMASVKSKVASAWKKVNKDKSPDDMPAILKSESSDMELVKKQDGLLQNESNYDNLLNMNEQELSKLSLMKRFVNWLVPDVEDNASIDLEASDNTQEEKMDIEILKEALSAVVDEKLNTFADSIKEEVEASIQTKIDDITKSFEVQKTELQEKLEATEKTLAEQEEQVKAFATSGAIKKSVDPEDEDTDEEIIKSAPKSFWGNLYLPQDLVKALGYES